MTDTLSIVSARGRAFWPPSGPMIALGLCALVLISGQLVPQDWLALNVAARGQPPSTAHLFGTDSLGRDIAVRTLAALANSLWTGLVASALSATIALTLALASAVSRRADALVGVLTELALGLPHFVLLIIIAYAAGGGAAGVMIAISLTHWPRLSRILRIEAQTVVTAEYVRLSRALGRSRLWVARHHLAPHLLPQYLVGIVLIFPHAILHEAGLSFVGLGIEPHLPSVGVMLAESLRAMLAGLWWVALFPGLGLVLVAVAVEVSGERLRRSRQPEGTV
ncbi:ABC transporter permease [Tabrizicola sp. WMC-M-20]|nr:ABC transporter permease [Tabrizicola sp. WMC-M-20]